MRRLALFDMDGTLCDYEGAMRASLQEIAGPSDPDFLDPNLSIWGLKSQSHMRARMKLVRLVPGWWANIPVFQLGWDVLHEVQNIGYDIQILTKGPSSNSKAWSEKIEWVHQHLGADTKVTVTQDKSVVYGRVLVDDYPGYVSPWLQHRPRGLAIMPACADNKDFSHPNAIRYDGTNLEEVVERLKQAYGSS